MKVKRGRFHQYDPFKDFADPETSGLVAHSDDYELGTPNLRRSENISLVAAESSLKHCLALRLKWRPNADGRTVTSISKLRLALDGKFYEFERVESYEPSEDSFMSPGRIMSYGSDGANLRLVVISPYRRMRLLFNGHMRQTVGGSNHDTNQLIYLKLNCFVVSVSEIFDFGDRSQVDDTCLRQLHREANFSRPLDTIKRDLVVHDRHEQRVKLNGEFLLIETGAEKKRRHGSMEIRGFYNRHFPHHGHTEQATTTRRLYAYANNGQSFQVVSRQLAGERIRFGYTAFLSQPRAKFIEKPIELDQAAEFERADLPRFSLKVSGQKCTFECSGERKLGDWFELEFNGKPGWAWWSSDDELTESELESVAIRKHRDSRELLLAAGKLCRPFAGPNFETTKPLVVSIEDDLCSSSDLVGAKASSLAQLYKFQTASSGKLFAVPSAVVLTRFAHDLILEANPNLRLAIDGLYQKADSDAFAAERRHLQDSMAALSLPSGLADEFWHRLTATIDKETAKFAVRSSSWGEDEAETSAAGQLDTVLNVEFDKGQLERAIMRCFASKFSSENVEYKRQHGQPVDLPMAVVVQRMVACDNAGVMFTCDPTNGDPSQVTISANFGLGETVVSGQTEPDLIRVRVALEPADYSLSNESPGPVSRVLEIEKVEVGSKETIITGGGGGERGEHDRTKCCLGDEQILRLAECGREVAAYFRSPRRDIEWGFEGGQLHLFQSRPVTGLEAYGQEELLHEFDRSLAGELNFYTRANVGEVMPAAARPLTANFCAFFWSLVSAQRNSCSARDAWYSPRCTGECVCEKYHFMFPCSQHAILSLDESNKSALTRSIEIGLFGREIGIRPEIAEASRGIPKVARFFDGYKFKLQTWRLRLVPERTVEQELGRIKRLREQVAQLELAVGYEQDKLLALYTQLHTAMQQVVTPWTNHYVVTLLSTQSNHALTTILAKYIKDAKRLCAATNRFLAISRDVISGGIPRRVAKLADLMRSLGPDELQQFVEMPAREAFEQYFSRPRADGAKLAAISRAFAEFIEEFGHRCYNEFDLSSQPWRQQPEQVVEMVQQNCRAPQRAADQTSTRDSTIDDVIKSLELDCELSLLDRLAIKLLVAPRGQLLMSLRERTKNNFIMCADVVRGACQLLAGELVRCQRLPDERLIFYLAFDELKPLCLAHQTAIVLQATRRRQLFERTFDVVWKFDEIFSELTPNHLRQSEELAEQLAKAPKLFGTPASSGKVRGRVCRVEGFEELAKVRPNSILLAHSTDIAFSTVFPLISGIITEVGGLVSHGAVVAREYGLPSLIGIPNVMRVLQDNEEIILDADNGVITRLDFAPDH